MQAAKVAESSHVKVGISAQHSASVQAEVVQVVAAAFAVCVDGQTKAEAATSATGATTPSARLQGRATLPATAVPHVGGGGGGGAQVHQSSCRRKSSSPAQASPLYMVCTNKIAQSWPKIVGQAIVRDSQTKRRPKA